MILSVNLNPCIDKSVTVENLRLGQLNRVIPGRSDAAGKGINVAMAVKQLGGESFCIGFNYSENGRLITNALDRAGILHDLVMVLGVLRTNLKLYDTDTGLYTDLNEPGSFVPEDSIADLRFRIRRRAERCRYVTLSGSVPRGVPEDIYKTIISDLKGMNVKTVLDAEGELLRQGIEAKPWLIKPNLTEMETLFGRTYQREEEIIEDARKITAQGVNLVCVSMGALGAILCSGLNVWKAYPVEDLDAKGYQGAGDSMVAGICLAWEKGLDLPTMLRYGAAAASASIIQEGTQMCTKLDFEAMLPRVKVEKIW